MQVFVRLYSTNHLQSHSQPKPSRCHTFPQQLPCSSNWTTTRWKMFKKHLQNQFNPKKTELEDLKWQILSGYPVLVLNEPLKEP